MKKISSRPFLFGLEKKIISDCEFYFDDEKFYALNPNVNGTNAEFKLSDIIELSKTGTIITNSRVWMVKIKQDTGNIIEFKFTHNYTLWNKNFYKFYDMLKQINPNVVKSKWSLWTM